MNNRLYNYILDAVNNNINVDRVQNVIGTAKFSYLKRIADDEVKLKEVVEELLEDEFVQNELNPELELNTDFLLEKTNDESTELLLQQITNLQEFDNSLSYLLNFDQKHFSQEKALSLIQETDNLLLRNNNFIYLLSKYFIAINDFDKAAYYLSKSSSLEHKTDLIIILAINSKFKETIINLIELFKLDINHNKNIYFYKKVFEILVDPHSANYYKKEDVILGMNHLYNSNISSTIDLTNFLCHLIRYYKHHQFTKKEVFKLIAPYLEKIKKSNLKNSPGLIGLYSLLAGISEEDNLKEKFEKETDKNLAKRDFELEDFDNYPNSISDFIINKLWGIKNFNAEFRKTRKNQLKNDSAKYELSSVQIFFILNFVNENILNTHFKNIKIKNYKLFKNHHIPLPSQTNIFIGFNGTGKTSLLQAIALGLLPKLDKDINPNDYEKFIAIGKEEVNLEVNWSDDILSRKLTIKDTGKTVDYPIFTHHEDEFLSRFILLGYGSNNFTKYTDHNYDDVVQKMLLGDNKFYHVNSLFEDYSDDFYDPLGILNTLDRYEVQDIDEKKKEAKIVKNLFLNALNELIVDYQIKQVRTSYKFFRGEEILDLKHLSEGYRAVILLVTDILIRVISLRPKPLEGIALMEEKPFVLENVLKEARGTILIDEFNRHLHPQWQRRFIDDLQKILPNVQFVLTTHSPIAVLGREEDEVQVLEFNEDGEIEIKKHKGGTKNLDVSLTLLKYFGLESVVSPQLQEKIDRYYELQINGERDEALEKELEDANLGIPIYDARYLKFLEFLKKRNIDIRDMERIEDIEVNDEEWNELENEFAELLD